MKGKHDGVCMVVKSSSRRTWQFESRSGFTLWWGYLNYTQHSSNTLGPNVNFGEELVKIAKCTKIVNSTAAAYIIHHDQEYICGKAVKCLRKKISYSLPSKVVMKQNVIKVYENPLEKKQSFVIFSDVENSREVKISMKWMEQPVMSWQSRRAIYAIHFFKERDQLFSTFQCRNFQ